VRHGQRGKKTQVDRLVRAERMMVRCMCGVSLGGVKSIAELLSGLGMVSVTEFVDNNMMYD